MSSEGTSGPFEDEAAVATAAADAAQDVIDGRIDASDLEDVDVTVALEDGRLDVDVYVNAPDAGVDVDQVAEDAALAARATVDERAR